MAQRSSSIRALRAQLEERDVAIFNLRVERRALSDSLDLAYHRLECLGYSTPRLEAYPRGWRARRVGRTTTWERTVDGRLLRAGHDGNRPGDGPAWYWSITRAWNADTRLDVPLQQAHSGKANRLTEAFDLIDKAVETLTHPVEPAPEALKPEPQPAAGASDVPAKPVTSAPKHFSVGPGWWWVAVPGVATLRKVLVALQSAPNGGPVLPRVNGVPVFDTEYEWIAPSTGPAPAPAAGDYPNTGPARSKRVAGSTRSPALVQALQAYRVVLGTDQQRPLRAVAVEFGVGWKALEHMHQRTPYSGPPARRGKPESLAPTEVAEIVRFIQCGIAPSWTEVHRFIRSTFGRDVPQKTLEKTLARRGWTKARLIDEGPDTVSPNHLKPK